MLARAGLGSALGAACLLALGTAASHASAETYRYTDEQGTLHFTDDPSTVPRPHRVRLEKIEGLSTSEPAEKPRSWPGWKAARSAIVSSLARTQSSRVDLEALKRFVDSWSTAFLITGLLWGLVTLGTAWHALLQRRFRWVIANLILHVVSVPLYVLLRLDGLGIPLRLGVLALWASPIVVGALAYRAALPLLTG